MIGAERAESTSLEIEHVDETNEMHARVVEAVPAVAFRVPAVALQVRSAVVGGDVVFPRNVEDAIGLHTFEDFIRGVELVGLCQLSDVAGVQHQRWRLWQSVQFCDGLFERPRDILVRLLVEADVAVADLGEENALALRLAQKGQPVQGEGRGNTGAQSPNRCRARPRHAAQESTPVDPVFAGVVDDVIGARRTGISFFVKADVIAVVMPCHCCGPLKWSALALTTN